MFLSKQNKLKTQIITLSVIAVVTAIILKPLIVMGKLINIRLAVVKVQFNRSTECCQNIVWILITVTDAGSFHI